MHCKRPRQVVPNLARVTVLSRRNQPDFGDFLRSGKCSIQPLLAARNFSLTQVDFLTSLRHEMSTCSALEMAGIEADQGRRGEIGGGGKGAVIPHRAP